MVFKTAAPPVELAFAEVRPITNSDHTVAQIKLLSIKAILSLSATKLKQKKINITGTILISKME